MVTKVSIEKIEGDTYKFNVTLSRLATVWVTPLGEIPLLYYR